MSNKAKFQIQELKHYLTVRYLKDDNFSLFFYQHIQKITILLFKDTDLDSKIDSLKILMKLVPAVL